MSKTLTIYGLLIALGFTLGRFVFAPKQSSVTETVVITNVDTTRIQSLRDSMVILSQEVRKLAIREGTTKVIYKYEPSPYFTKDETRKYESTYKDSLLTIKDSLEVEGTLVSHSREITLDTPYIENIIFVDSIVYIKDSVFVAIEREVPSPPVKEVVSKASILGGAASQVDFSNPTISLDLGYQDRKGRYLGVGKEINNDKLWLLKFKMPLIRW